MTQRVSSTMRANSPVNHLINGGFRIWQRGTSFSVGPGVYTADKWRTDANATTSMNINQTTDSKFGEFALIAEDLSTNNRSDLLQVVEDAEALQGQTITMSAWVKQGPNNPSSEAVISIVLDNASGDSTKVELTGEYQRVMATAEVPEDETRIRPLLGPVTSNSDTKDAIFDGVTLTVGDEPVDYPSVVRPIGQEQVLCERYYETLSTDNEGSSANPWVPIVGINSGNPDVQKSYSYRQTKSAVPVVSGNISSIAVESHGSGTTSGATDTGNWSIDFLGTDEQQLSMRLRRSASLGDDLARLGVEFEAEVT